MKGLMLNQAVTKNLAEADPPRDVIVAICTFNRNKELDHLLEKLIEYGNANWSEIRIGLTVIDDSPGAGAKSVVDKYSGQFPLGAVYENSASRNISIARNLALAKSINRGAWIAMTDDDCEPSEQWLSELVRVRALTKADVVTGLMLRRAPSHAPAWISEQPFLELGEFSAGDGDELSVAQTNNSLISSSFLLSHPELQFDPRFGRIGGEDMAFFHSLKMAGAKIVFAAHAFVYENEPDNRLTLRYQLRRYYWHGNSSIHTSLESGKWRVRLLIHALATLIRAAARPVARAAQGGEPQFLFALALLAEGFGKLAGIAGIRVSHK